MILNIRLCGVPPVPDYVLAASIILPAGQKHLLSSDKIGELTSKFKYQLR